MQATDDKSCMISESEVIQLNVKDKLLQRNYKITSPWIEPAKSDLQSQRSSKFFIFLMGRTSQVSLMEEDKTRTI